MNRSARDRLTNRPGRAQPGDRPAVLARKAGRPHSREQPMKQTIISCKVIARIKNEDEEGYREVVMTVGTMSLRKAVLDRLLQLALPEFAKDSK